MTIYYRDVYPEKKFEQLSINNHFFSGVIKWKSNRKPSWGIPGVDQWRYELRFDEVKLSTNVIVNENLILTCYLFD